MCGKMFKDLYGTHRGTHRDANALNLSVCARHDSLLALARSRPDGKVSLHVGIVVGPKSTCSVRADALCSAAGVIGSAVTGHVERPAETDECCSRPCGEYRIIYRIDEERPRHGRLPSTRDAMIAGALSEIARVGNSRSRAITAENRRGEPGAGGAEASALGPGRKGSAKIALAAGETTVLAEITGTGVVRHVWMTVADRTAAGGDFVLRDLVLRAYWDGEETPSVEVPLGDFFCNGFARRTQVISIPIVVAPNGGMNCYFPMPFRTGARITVTSEHSADIESFFYQIDYSLEDELPPDVGYFHAQWRRQALTVRGRDHVILSDVTGPGTYVGTYIALSCIERYWWGEGEMKFFIDGDTELPTICGTGLEDYVGGAWGFHTTPQPGVEPQVLTYNAPYSGYDRHTARDEPGRPRTRSRSPRNMACTGGICLTRSRSPKTSASRFSRSGTTAIASSSARTTSARLRTGTSFLA